MRHMKPVYDLTSLT